MAVSYIAIYISLLESGRGLAWAILFYRKALCVHLPEFPLFPNFSLSTVLIPLLLFLFQFYLPTFFQNKIKVYLLQKAKSDEK